MATLAGEDKVQHLDTSIARAAPTELPKLSDLVEKGDGGDYMSRLKAMASKQEGETGGAAALAVGALDIDIGAILGPAEGHLRQARQLIEQEEYAEAIGVLDQALAAAPNHPEAIYMTALCLARLNQPIEALRALAVLRGERLTPAVQTRVGVLREEIRRQTVPVVVFEQIALMLGHQSDQALERLRTLCELDPEMAMFHYMLAGALLTAGRLDEAAAAADEGLRSCGDRAAGDDGVQGLRDIRRQIRRRRLLKEMEPARKQYRKGKLGKARSELLRLEPDSRGDPLWSTFDDYVQELQAHGVRFSRRNGGALASVTPHGSFKDVDALHFLLVGEEIQEAKAHLAGGRPDKAESEIDDAMRYAPSFPYAHFLKARCMYERLGGDTMPPLEMALAQLEEARGHAQLATQDPDLTDTNLLEAIDGAIEAIRHVEQELKLVAEDAELLNPVVDDFHKLMKVANEGISGPDAFDKIDKRLKSLQGRVQNLKSRMKSQTGGRMLTEFTKVLEANRKQLEGIRPQLAEAKVVNALQKEFMTIMGSASGGVASYELPGIRSRLEKLMTDINAALPTVKSPAGQSALFDLAKAVQRNLDQARSLM